MSRFSKFIILIFLVVNTIYAFNTNNIINPFEKIIKSMGISNLEKSLLKSAKYVYVSGKLVAKRSETFFPHTTDALGRTNIERMKQGLAPIGKDGKPVELHHLKQKDDGIIVELTSAEHKKYSSTLHKYRKNSEINRQEFNKWRKQYWKNRAKDFE
jgi:hypothetical protein